MEFVIIWFIVGLVSAKYSVPDIAAAVKGNPVPSHERRMERLRQTGADTSHQRQPGTVREALRATVDNAAERAAITRQAKHDGKLRSLEERREHIADSAYERQKAKAQRGSGIVGAFARARGLLSDLRERRTEGQAWRENARRESLPQTTDLVEDQVVDEPADTGEGPDNVVPLRRRDEDTDSSREPAESSESESENPADTDELTDEQAQTVRQWRAGLVTGEDPAVPPRQWQALPVRWRARLLDEAVRAGADPWCTDANLQRRRVVELDREAAELMHENPSCPTAIESELDRGQGRAAPQERSETDNVTEQNGEPAMPEQSQPEHTEIQQAVPEASQESGPSYETTNLTLTLQRVQASSNACHGQVSSHDQRLAELQSEHTALGTQIAGLEAQIAALQGHKNAGEQIRQLQQAQEQLAAAQNEVSEQITHTGNALEAYQAAGGFFDGAHAEFSRHVAGQDFYTAESDAGDKEFLTQG